MKTNTVFRTEEGKVKVLTYYKELLCSLPVSCQEKFVKTSFGETYLLEAGNIDNPVMLLFHGSCSNSAMWFGDIGALSRQYRVLAVDIIGEAGNSAENRLDLISDGYAQWIRELMDALCIQKAILMGNSFGGWMSLKFATAFPERVNKLVLIATSGITPTRLSFILKSIYFTMRGEKGLKYMNKMIFGTEKIPKEVTEFSNLIMKNFKPMMGALPIYTDEQLKRLTMPVLYIAGEKDVTVDTGKTEDRIIKFMPSAQIHLLKDSGHVIYNILDTILPFLNE